MSVNKQQVNGNPAAFAELHEKYGERLLNRMIGIVRDRDAAEDIAATAWAKALWNSDSFRGDASFYTWLNAIAFNEARAHWRHAGIMSLEGLDNTPAFTEAALGERSFEGTENRRQIQVALSGVPAKYRRALVDHFIHGLRIKEIARREGIPVGTVLSRIFTGKRLLRRAFRALT